MGAGAGVGLGKGGVGTQNFFPNTGIVPMSDKPETIKSGQVPMSVRGQRRETGEEVYIEVRGPSGIGSKSKTPYQNVLPQYRRSAEQALDKNKIPREYQSRVREYFRSLEEGK